MMDFRQKAVVLLIVFLMNAFVWVAALLFGGLLGLVLAVMFTMSSGGVVVRVVAM